MGGGDLWTPIRLLVIAEAVRAYVAPLCSTGNTQAVQSSIGSRPVEVFG